MASIAILVLGTAGVIAVSWRCLRHPASHGFPRSLAFELILILFALNYRFWFRDPASLTQLLSWLLLTASAAFVIASVSAFRRSGRSHPPDPGSPLFAIENTSCLVTAGLYGHVRHPMYASLLFLIWGIAFKSLSPITCALAALATLLVLSTAYIEERENLARFGSAYHAYMGCTRRFIPYLF